MLPQTFLLDPVLGCAYRNSFLASSSRINRWIYCTLASGYVVVLWGSRSRTNRRHGLMEQREQTKHKHTHTQGEKLGSDFQPYSRRRHIPSGQLHDPSALHNGTANHNPSFGWIPCHDAFARSRPRLQCSPALGGIVTCKSTRGYHAPSGEATETPPGIIPSVRGL